MQKIINLILLAATLTTASAIAAPNIIRVEPANWWIGMKKSEFQIMVYGPGVGQSTVRINYPGVTLKEAAKVENANYLFLYLIISSARTGAVPIIFRNGLFSVMEGTSLLTSTPLNAHTDRNGAQGFNASDVHYLITPDRFANSNPGNDERNPCLKTPNRKDEPFH